MKNKSKLLNILLYMALIGIGITIGIAIRHYHNLPLSETINIIDIATLVTTVFLAVYIPEVLDRRLQTSRDKKELLEKRIVEYQDLLRKVNNQIQGDARMSQDDFLTMQNSLDVAAYKVESLERLMDLAKLGSTFPSDMEAIRKMDEEHRKLLSTPGDRPIQVYSEQIREKEAQLYNKLDEAATVLIFKLSDA